MNKLKNILKNMEKLSKSPARRAIGVPRGDTHAHAAPWLAGRPLGGHTCHASKSLPNPAWRGRRRHFCRTLLMGLLLCCSFITGTMYGIESQDAKGDLTAISDGEGSVVLLWFPPVGEWPRGGWRLTNEKGKVLKKKIKQGDKKLQTSLSRKDSKALADIVKGLETANTPEEKKQRYGMLGLMMASDIELARGMGLCYTVGKVKKGEQRYRVIGLDARGKKTALVLTSNPVDAWQATPLPPIPTDLEASALPGGTALYWSPVPENTFPPVAAYSISRVDEQGKKESLTDSPLILGTKWEKSRPVFTDGAAPVEQSSIYLVSSVDLFQRRSIPARLEFFRPSVLALRAPSALKGTAGKGKIILSWRHHGNPFTRGIVIERSIMQKGPFEVLTPDGISPDQTSYEDPGVRGGTVYYYRMRSAGPRGDVGEPSALVSVTAINKTPPPAVTGLKVNVGRTRVRLSWQAMEFPVAGFQVERQMPNGKWFRLNRKLSQENVYNDYYGRGNGSVFRYRVKAIAFDQQEGAYCESPEVKIEDMRLPPAPRINRVSGKGGLAVISFSPAHPEERSRQFLLLRGRTADEPGVVMGDPLPAGAREFTDSFVAAGKSYWYHVVALDKRGNRSNYSRGVKVTVGLPPVPVPSAPKLIFLNKPFTHVRLEWEDVPEGFLVVVERRKEGDTNWRFLMGDLAGKEAMDMHPPRAGKTFYRILYRTVSGEAGKPSGVTVLQKK